jgi:hypothetical protein
MSLWTPEWKVLVNGVDYASATVANLTVTRGRSSIYEQPVAGYCYLQLLDVNGDTFDLQVGHQISVQLKNSAGNFITIYGGYISDIATSVISTGSTATVMGINITALGALARLSRSTWSDALSKDDEGSQIFTIVSEALANDWQELPAAETWANYTPATTTWATAENIGLGNIDTGVYEMVARAADPVNSYTYVAQLADSALGTVYEDDDGRVAYDNQDHRQDYLIANGFTTLSANDALGVGIRSQIRSGDMRNNVTVVYKNGQTVIDSDADSILNFGNYAEIIETTLDLQADAQAYAERLILLRSFPRPILDAVSYPLGSPELDNTDRDALIDIFLGQPIELTDLPSAISSLNYQGYVEGWTFQAGFNSVNLTFILSPLSYSGYWQRWEQVNPAESWNSVLNTLEWQDAIGVIS